MSIAAVSSLLAVAITATRLIILAIYRTIAHTTHPFRNRHPTRLPYRFSQYHLRVVLPPPRCIPPHPLKCPVLDSSTTLLSEGCTASAYRTLATSRHIHIVKSHIRYAHTNLSLLSCSRTPRPFRAHLQAQHSALPSPASLPQPGAPRLFWPWRPACCPSVPSLPVAYRCVHQEHRVSRSDD